MRTEIKTAKYNESAATYRPSILLAVIDVPFFFRPNDLLHVWEGWTMPYVQSSYFDVTTLSSVVEIEDRSGEWYYEALRRQQDLERSINSGKPVS